MNGYLGSSPTIAGSGWLLDEMIEPRLFRVDYGSRTDLDYGKLEPFI